MSKFNTVKIGKTEVEATALGLGTNAVGGYNLFPNLVDETGIEIVKAGLDNGITLLDTAFAYGLGHSEELIGQAIKGYDRSKIIIATKGAQNGDNLDNSPAFLKQTVENSLKRLGTDYLDIFYIHFPDDHTPKDEAVAALTELKKAGKIRAVGVSNFTLDQLKEANQDGGVDIIENQYNLFNRDAEKDLFPYLKENHISFVPFFPLASGLLTGKYTAPVTFPEGDMRGGFPEFQPANFQANIDKVAQLKPIAEAYAVNTAQLVLAWYMKNPAVDVVIPGAKNPDQVIGNAKAGAVNLSDADYKKISDLF